MSGRSLVFSAAVVVTASALLGGVFAAVPAQATGRARPDPAPKPEAWHYLRAAAGRAKPRPVELAGKRTATSRTYQLPDGSRRLVALDGPVNYRDQRGRWATIDDRLGRSSRPGYAAQNAANRYRLLIPADAGADPGGSRPAAGG